MSICSYVCISVLRIITKHIIYIIIIVPTSLRIIFFFFLVIKRIKNIFIILSCYNFQVMLRMKRTRPRKTEILDMKRIYTYTP